MVHPVENDLCYVAFFHHFHSWMLAALRIGIRLSRLWGWMGRKEVSRLPRRVRIGESMRWKCFRNIYIPTARIGERLPRKWVPKQLSRLCPLSRDYINGRSRIIIPRMQSRWDLERLQMMPKVDYRDRRRQHLHRQSWRDKVRRRGWRISPYQVFFNHYSNPLLLLRNQRINN